MFVIALSFDAKEGRPPPHPRTDNEAAVRLNINFDHVGGIAQA